MRRTGLAEVVSPAAADKGDIVSVLSSISNEMLSRPSSAVQKL